VCAGDAQKHSGDGITERRLRDKKNPGRCGDGACRSPRAFAFGRLPFFFEPVAFADRFGFVVRFVFLGFTVLLRRAFFADFVLFGFAAFVELLGLARPPFLRRFARELPRMAAPAAGEQRDDDGHDHEHQEPGAAEGHQRAAARLHPPAG
jgi:hypothetical protein